MLQGTEAVTKEDIRCCKDFVKAYMPYDEVPFHINDALVYHRLKWYLQADGDTKAYFRLFTVETIKIEIKEKIEVIENKDTPYSGRDSAVELKKFLKKHPWEEGWEEESSSDSDEDNKDNKDNDDDSEYDCFGGEGPPEGHPLDCPLGHPICNAYENDN